MRKGPQILSVLVFFLVSVGALAAVLVLNYKPILGLDLQGGASVVYKPTRTVSQSTLDQTISIIRNRVDGLGVAQPNIAQQGKDIVVQLPGIKHPNQALALIGQTAQLEFRPVLCALPPYKKPNGQLAKTIQAHPLTAFCPTSAQQDAIAQYIPNTTFSQLNSSKEAVLTDRSGPQVIRYVLGPTLANGTALSSAVAGLNQQQQWVVNFSLTPKATPLFNQIATTYFDKQLAIVLDTNVISAPVITTKSFNGQGQITGLGGQTQAENLALVLKYGALPVQLQQLTVQTISPTLGKASLRAGVYAGIGGLLLVLLYTVFYYRALGVVVLAGLGTTAALLWAIVSLLGHTSQLTLDLSGVTGLIVSIGVTVDSYVVFFERLKDELRGGKSLRSSVDKSFAKAFRTIVAADLVSLIGATLLYLLSIGPVRGFAFFLGLSTLLDVVSAWFFTRPLVILMGQSPIAKNPKFFRRKSQKQYCKRCRLASEKRCVEAQWSVI
jgi:preprotein translocase subunit SecD